jgi:hypothetical protein
MKLKSPLSGECYFPVSWKGGRMDDTRQYLLAMKNRVLALGDVQIRVQIQVFRRIYSQHEVRFLTEVAEKMGNPEHSVT